MKITTKAHYGLMAMCELAKRYGDQPSSARELAELQNCSLSYMEQIFALLKKAQLIHSSRGAYGGYTLEKEPEEISIGEIIRALEGPISFTECSSDETLNTDCSLNGECCSRKFWQDLYEHVNTFLEEKKLADLINN